MFTWIDSTTLKIASAVFMFIGTALVSWRVTVILKALSFALKVHDLNNQIRAAAHSDPSLPMIQMHGTHGQIKSAERFGFKLLVFGFLMQLIGVVCNILSFLV